MPIDSVLTIKSLGRQGDGIALIDGRQVFVPLALPGEQVRVRVGPLRRGVHRGAVLERLSDSQARTTPPCQYFDACGGCAAQHMADEPYGAWKSDGLRAAMTRCGLDQVPIAPLRRSPAGSRRRARLHAIRRGGEVTLGFRARGSDRVVETATCLLLTPALRALIPPLKVFLATMEGWGRSVELALTDTDTGVDLSLVGDCAPTLADRERLAAFAAAQDIARIALGPRLGLDVVILRRPPRMRFGDAAVDLPPDAFVQPTRAGETAIAEMVRTAVGGARSVVDLYAGCGSLALVAAATGARVHAVEGDRAAADALIAASRHSNRELTVERRDLVRRPLQPDELARFAAAVIDPPRAGAEPQARALVASQVRTVVSASCNPATFARDAAILVEGGYRLDRVEPIDQFLWSPHLEVVGVFRR